MEFASIQEKARFERDLNGVLDTLALIIYDHTRGSADKAYVYVMNEPNYRGAMVTFRVGNIVVDPYTLPKASSSYIPDEDTYEFLNQFDHLALRLLDVFPQHNQPTPYGVQYIYDEDTGDSKVNVIESSIMPEVTGMLGNGWVELWFAHEYREGLRTALEKGTKLAVEMKMPNLLLSSLSAMTRNYLPETDKALVYASETLLEIRVKREGRWEVLGTQRGEYPETKAAFYSALEESVREGFRILRANFNPTATDVRLKCGRRAIESDAYWGFEQPIRASMDAWFDEMIQAEAEEQKQVSWYG